MGQVNYQLDGVGHNDTYLNVNVPFPNPDAIQEFNLQANNFTAEYGNAGGGIVNIVTRSGTNQLHGSAFEFLRNGSLNARNFFAPTQDTLKRNQFGGSVGGPILKNRLFFFGTYQGTRVTTAASGNITFVPTAAERRGDFLRSQKQLIDPVTKQPFPNNQIPAGAYRSGCAIFPEQHPAPERSWPSVDISGNSEFAARRSVHAQGGLYCRQTPDQLPVLLQQVQPAGGDTAEGESARGQQLRKRGPRPEHWRESHLYDYLQLCC